MRQPILKFKIILTLILTGYLLFFSYVLFAQKHFYYPPEGNHISHQDQRTPRELGLENEIINEINSFMKKNPHRQKGLWKSRWSLWRNGYLVHVEGDFYQKSDVASLRKTWHAMIVGAAIQQGKIKNIEKKINQYLPELKGNDAKATWEDVLTQTAGFDYPYDDYPDYKPGEMWTYSDLNLVNLCNALAKVYGKKDYYDHYDEVAERAFFNDIGLKGWETGISKDHAFGNKDDGVRFVLNLEHMGRLGLLALSRGKWAGEQLISKSFTEALETKQTYGIKVNYDGPNDGKVEFNMNEYPESPYGYMTWVNTDGDLFRGADKYWALASGGISGRVIWNKKNGIVFACIGFNPVSDEINIPLIIENNIISANPLLEKKPIPKVGQWSYFTVSTEYRKKIEHPYEKIQLYGNFTAPDGKTEQVRGFYDGGKIWKIRYMPSSTGLYKYELFFNNGEVVKAGVFEARPSDIPGMIHKYRDNPIWFGYKQGDAELIRSFHVGDKFLAESDNVITGEEWSKRQRTKLLNWLQNNGYNMLSIAGLFLNRDTDGRGKGWSTPDLWDSENQRPDYMEYRHLENILEDLSIRKMLIYPFAGFFGRDSDFPNSDDKKSLFLKYTIDRIGAYWNMFYVVGGPEPLMKNEPYLSKNEVNQWGSVIDSLDIYNHLLSCHNQTGGIDIFEDESWSNYGILQWPKTTDREQMSKILCSAHHNEKSLYAQETLWPGNKYHPNYSKDDIRKNAIVLIMSAAMIYFADMDGNSSTGFSGTLDTTQAHYEIHKIVKHV
jgi:CubicO group peptidase (beta-lactamase class C family)